jgi:hypothetical protein
LYLTRNFESEKAELVMFAICDKSIIRNLSDCLSADSPTVATLKKYVPSDAKALIWEQIESTMKAVNVGRGIESDSIREIVDFIFSEYYFLTYAEIKTFFYFCKTGKFGKLYDRFDMQTICLQLVEFDNMRTPNAIARSESGKGKPSEAVPMPAELLALIARLEPPKPKFLVLNTTFDEYCNLPHIQKNYLIYRQKDENKANFEDWARQKYIKLTF